MDSDRGLSGTIDIEDVASYVEDQLHNPIIANALRARWGGEAVGLPVRDPDELPKAMVAAFNDRYLLTLNHLRIYLHMLGAYVKQEDMPELLNQIAIPGHKAHDIAKVFLEDPQAALLKLFLEIEYLMETAERHLGMFPNLFVSDVAIEIADFSEMRETSTLTEEGVYGLLEALVRRLHQLGLSDAPMGLVSLKPSDIQALKQIVDKVERLDEFRGYFIPEVELEHQ